MTLVYYGTIAGSEDVDGLKREGKKKLNRKEGNMLYGGYIRIRLSYSLLSTSNTSPGSIAIS